MSQQPEIPASLLAAIRQAEEVGQHELAAILRKRALGLGTALAEVEKILVNFVSVDKDTLALKDQVILLAQVSDSVLIQGETGTGKELIARALGSERTGKFVSLNCAAMPEGLLESELFGYAANSFTSAKGNDQTGLIDYAGEGTIFLDEIGDMPPMLQSKLLRCIESRMFRRVGGKAEMPVDCRFIAATHHDLAADVASGKFRRDLYARLSTFELFIKPLRDRLTDIPQLINKYNSQQKKLPPQCTKNLELWRELIPLNVRSVQRIIRRWEVLNELPEVFKEKKA